MHRRFARLFLALGGVLAIVGCSQNGQPIGVGPAPAKATEKEPGSSQTTAKDWVHWRGPTQNGVSYDTGLPDKFSLDPKDPNSNCIWTQPFGCRSTPVVMNGRVYIINSAGEGINEGERVMCFDADTGKVQWEDKFNLFHTDIVTNRVGWTSPVGDPETGNVYIHGTQGFLRCYDKDGKILWNRNLTEEYGRVTGYGGRVVGPTLDGDLLIVGMINGSWGDFARGANRFVAFDKKTGQVVWWSSLPNQIYVTYYSNPVVAVINGQRLLITGGAEGGLHALQVRTGKLVWSYTFARTVINSSPVVEGNYIYCTHGETNLDTNEQGRLVCVDAGQLEATGPDAPPKPKLVWEVVGIKFFYASPVVHDGVVYVCSDSARLYRYDAKTGKPIGRPYPYGVLARGSPVWVDGKLFVFNVNGEMHVLKPGKTKMEELHVQRFRPREGVGFVETNGTPAVANGKMYFGTLESFYCIGTKNGKAGSAPSPPAEDKGDDKVAQIQVLPADVVLHAGGSAEFTVKAFNANGVPLDVKPEGKWDIVLPPKQPNGRQPPKLDGELKSEGIHSKLTVSKMTGQQGYVEFVSNGISGRARVRVAPQLPYKQDFEKVPVGAAPGGWVNTMGKFDVIDMNGAKVLRKIATNPAPPVARANGYIGLPELNNYTIQADVSAQGIRDGLPDIGLLNCRYHLILDGKQDLRITSWEAKPRINHGIPFNWKPNSWYTMVLTVEQIQDKATIRGKVWPRGETEPNKWTIEFEDPSPNREGAPAIYAYISNVLGNQPGSEAYFDNVSVVPNGKK